MFELPTAELPTAELRDYRVHTVPRDMIAYRSLRRDVADRGVQQPLVVATDGQYAVLEDGTKRTEVAWELHIGSLPVTIRRREFSIRRRVKWPVGPHLAALLSEQASAPAPEPAPAAKPRKRRQPRARQA